MSTPVNLLVTVANVAAADQLDSGLRLLCCGSKSRIAAGTVSCELGGCLMPIDCDVGLIQMLGIWQCIQA